MKTYNGALGVDIHENAHQTILELAKAAGLATGNVSTAELRTPPAALVAHVTSRKCYGPTVTSEKCAMRWKKGQNSITEQLLNARPDVTGRRREDLPKRRRRASGRAKPCASSARATDCDRRGFSCRRDGSQSG